MSTADRASKQVHNFTRKLSVPQLLTVTRRAHIWLVKNVVEIGELTVNELKYMTADEKLAEVDFYYDGGLKRFYEDHNTIW